MKNIKITEEYPRPKMIGVYLISSDKNYKASQKRSINKHVSTRLSEAGIKHNKPFIEFK